MYRTIKKYLNNTYNFIQQNPLASIATSLSILITTYTVYIIYKITGAVIDFILLFTE